MELEFQVMSLADLDEILVLERRKLESELPDEMSRTLVSWSAKWRRESLEHYLPLGWSFCCRLTNQPQIVGYFLAQPFLFYRGQTQTLWVEYLSSHDPVAGQGVLEALADVAVRVGREKHLQRVLFADGDRVSAAVAKWSPDTLADEILEVKTTKS